MSDPLAPIGEGHTELAEEDRLGLLPTYIATKGELYEAEQRNLVQAMIGRHPSTSQLLDDKYLRDLHRAMLGKVWRWAGSYRRRETIIGIEPGGIAVAMRQLIDDTRAWVEFATFSHDELAVRFHHRLVQIHPFANGNGRHGRIAADLLAQSLGAPRFTWGANLQVNTDELRRRYRSALYQADAGKISALLTFARS